MHDPLESSAVAGTGPPNKDPTVSYGTENLQGPENAEKLDLVWG